MSLDRSGLEEVWRGNRERTRRFFREVLSPEAWAERPIPLRHPFLFYEGHLAAFGVNTLVRRALGRAAVSPEAEVLFERGIDTEAEAASPAGAAWPSRAEVEAYVGRADRAVEDALATAELFDEGNPLLTRGEAVFTLLEHELMHQETLLYMLHRLPYAAKSRPVDAPALETDGASPRRETVRIPAGTATLGADVGEIPFGWDNEHPRHAVSVPAFGIEDHAVTNEAYLDFVEAGGYDDAELWDADDFSWVKRHGVSHPLFWEKHDGAWRWRGQFELVPLPPPWPVWVSHAEASAYARWKGRRLPTEPEYHRAAFGDPSGAERRFPWGDAAPSARHGNFGGELSDPVPAGSRPDGASAWGLHDLLGNGWEWTSTVFAGFPGFRPMASYPGYSADFFDGKHWVLKGASPGTSAALVRRSFRNWFQGRYPYVYAKFRCVEP